MLYFLRFFFLFIALYHILFAVIIFGIFGGQFSGAFSFMKDFLWVGFVFFLVLTNFKIFIEFVKKFKYILITLIGFTLWGLAISYINHKSMFDIVVGLKYDIYFLVVIVTSLFVGMVIAFKHKNDFIGKFYEWLFKLLCISIVGGFLWQLLKLGFTDVFLKIGYGPVGDYILGKNPPVYYRTGPGGVARLSGIFAGPNNYGYILVLFFSFILYKLQNIFRAPGNSVKLYICYFIYFISLILTISRGAIIGVIVQLLIIFKKYFLKPLNIVLLSIIMIAGIIGISIWKGKSTMEHINKSMHSVEYVTSNIMGYGLGSSGPAVHYNGYILPENTYLQILIDTGIFGFILFSLFFGILFYNIYKILSNRNGHNSEYKIYLKLLTFGLIGIFFEGFFLHVFEDSMINYLFFVSWGILIGYLVYLPKESL